MRRLPALLIVAALSACGDSGQSGDGAAAPSANAGPAPNAAEPAAPPAANAADASDPRPAVGQKAGIPAVLHGRWALDAADCAKPKGAATGLMTVTADELRFYESRAQPVGNFLTATGDSFDAEFAFEGEGQRWQNRQRLRRLGDELLRTDGSQTESIAYVRCP